MSAPAPELAEFLREAGLAEAEEQGEWTPLAGGVSSDIWRVELASGAVCVKRALRRLKVTAEWTAPVGRNAFEWEYMKVADRIAPGCVPRPIAQDLARGLFAMAWLGPDRHRLWKTELLSGKVHPEAAAALGDVVGRIHRATARDPSVPARFATDATFHALRLDPYLLATAAVHPDLAGRLRMVARTTSHTRRALVHGDVSPKNVLLGADGPVLLDAECAWFGDPAFDLAFCLTHLVVKARVVAGGGPSLSAAYEQFAGAYLAQVDWESRRELEGRAAALLPALALARVDGKSTLEYLDDAQRRALREVARSTILATPDTLAGVKQLLLR